MQHHPIGPLQWLDKFPVDGPALIDGAACAEFFAVALPVQRYLTADTATRNPGLVRPSDFQLNLDFDRPGIIDLPPSNLRRGKPLRILDVGGKCRAFPVTLIPHGHEKIWNGVTPLVLDETHQVVTLWPFFDGVHRGWWRDPPRAR